MDFQENSRKEQTQFVFCTQQYASRMHSRILAHCSQHAIVERITGLSKYQCRWKSHIIPRKGVGKYGRSKHIQNTYKFSNFHPKRKICRMVHRELLPINAHGTVITYYNPYQIILSEIITLYNFNDLFDQNGWIYMKIIRGIYRLTQADIFANNLPAQH